MADTRYEVPVGGISSDKLPESMQAAMKELEGRFPSCGIALFVMDLGGEGGLAYIANVQRESLVGVAMEWIAKQREN